ncbi:hypothetical protein OIU34_07410 [Pararhizobium sp. BT-229]|uniref:hypothetical protein n=1 Tax=Pararhizobium sp. BT-229 TaxID=2986923 RepID=UPI0021F6B17D|nr:hypothetical protein [Pararhizobium sp. BT-229]MCV9961728.1 hypothetical protein [Pararhizobium sp. BT-229]
MMSIVPPSFDERKRRQLQDEFFARAHLWLPDWQPGGDRTDVAAAFLKIAATLGAEVTQRLNRMPEKNFRGLLHWLGKRGRNGQVARMPVVFKMSDRAEPVLAAAPVRLQADAAGTPIIFETEETIRLVASTLQAVFASKGADTFYKAFPGLSDLAAPVPAPDEWRLLSPAAKGATQVQLDPPEGLVAEMILRDDNGEKYRVTEAKDGLVTLSPGIGITAEPAPSAASAADVYEGKFHRASSFSPFDGKERDRQDHALYLGGADQLDIKTAAIIALEGDLPAGCIWSYWGKARGKTESDWQNFDVDPAKPDVLAKGEGEIELTEIGGKKLRWLRAVPEKPDDVKQALVGDIKFTINCDDDEAKTSIAFEALANSTPVVLKQGFYPFGREPRQFDAFYLSGPEAFGKPHACAMIDIRLDDSIAGPMNSLSNAEGDSLVAGIHNGGGLRIVHVARTAQQGETLIHFLPPSRPESDPSQPIKFLTEQKVGSAFDRMGDEIGYFSMTDGRDVWLWSSTFPLSQLPEPPTDDLGDWLSRVGPAVAEGGTILETCLVFDPEGMLKVYVLMKNGEVYGRLVLVDAAKWELLSVKVEKATTALTRLVPFEDCESDPGAASDQLGLAGVTRDGKLVYCEHAGADWTEVKDFVTTGESYPLALLQGKQRFLYARGGGADAGALKAFKPGSPSVHTPWAEPLIGEGFSFLRQRDGEPIVLFASRNDDNKPGVAIWQPFADATPHFVKMPFVSPEIAQAPVRLPDGYLLPLAQGAVAPSRLPQLPFIQSAKTASQMTGIALPKEMPDDAGDVVLLRLPDPSDDNKFFLADRSGDTGFALRSPYLRKRDGLSGTVHQVNRARTGTVKARRKIELEPGDADPVKGSVLCICTKDDPHSDPVNMLFTIDDVTETPQSGGPDKRVATVTEDLPFASGKRAYFKVGSHTDLTFDIRPNILIDTHLTQSFDPKDVIVEFVSPRVTTRLKMAPIQEDGMDRLVLDETWSGAVPAVGSTVRFIRQQSIGAAVSPPAPRNPELSWEYWNGSGWWQIPDIDDGTRNLVRSGVVKFCVPEDLQPSEVAGRMGHWIRTRLVGGDYGQETVKVETTRSGRTSTQIVIRDPSTIRAPYIYGVNLTYHLCRPVMPDRVITLDSGAYRDQTEINRAANARVEIFTPLVDGLKGAVVTAGTTDTPTECCADCSSSATKASDSDGTSPEVAAPDKAIYLGFTGPLQGEAVAILFLVDETPLDSDLPLEVEAFANSEFKPIRVKDETRALSQSGILTLSLPEPLQRVSFFGESLHWLRLKPAAGAAKAWSPKIRGIYLNSVWASAGETRVQEIVGRSDGSPDQMFNLAHVPVLDDTLELRIREPIGDEEKADLLKANPDSVRDAIGEWPGPWVRWYPADLATAAQNDRVFDFDASVGIITFGNGRRGAIPPIGSDNILAVTYRSGGAAAGNDVSRWSRPNLISPLRGIEETVAPEGAAGGSDPQDAATALRFVSANIAMRDRAVTLQDFERQAVQSSPDIVQARAFLSGAGISLVAVKSGSNPLPTSAIRSALARYLRSRAAPVFRRPKALAVEGPDLIAMELSVVIAVADLAKAGSIAERVQKRVLALFDTASGGVDGQGWRLGTTITQTDVAAVIADIPGVDEIDPIAIHRQDGLLGPVGPRQLATLSESSLSITCRQSLGEVA